jgi:hypothetical protein
MALNGLHVKTPDQILLVHVRVDNRVWLVLPNDDIEITHGSYVVKLREAGQWEVEQFDSNGAAADRVASLVN